MSKSIGNHTDLGQCGGQNAASYRPGWHNHPHIQPNNQGFQPGHINHQPGFGGNPTARVLVKNPRWWVCLKMGWDTPYICGRSQLWYQLKYHVVSDKYPYISRWIIAPFQNLRDPCSTIISSWIYLYTSPDDERHDLTFRTSKCFGRKCFTASKRMPDTPVQQQVAWWT